MRIAVDAMGGDQAPAATVRGALLEASRDRESTFLLVGDGDRIRAEIDAAGWGGASPSSIEIVPATDTVGMGEPPLEALRRKRDSSIQKAVGLVQEKQADALVSAGNTGATVGATTLTLRLLKGVRRPGIAASTPTVRGVATIIDVGANMQCKPLHLLQYGVMASVYYQHMHGHPDPRVGLLNVGAEDQKGNDLVRKTSQLLRGAHINFAGNVEGQEIYQGNCQVFVCEGFAGNLILKVSEGVALGLLEMKKRRLTGHPMMGTQDNSLVMGKIRAWLFRKFMNKLRNAVDYSEYGGAPLLGVDGVCIIAHGRSGPKAIANAIRVAREFRLHDVNGHIVEEIEALREPVKPRTEVG